MRSILQNKSGRFIPFWIFLGVLGILLIGSFITPFKIVLDDIFNRIETNAANAPINSTASHLSCNDSEAPQLLKATCFTLGGFMIMFVLYLLYSWVSGMYNGARSPTPVFSQRYRMQQAALNG